MEDTATSFEFRRVDCAHTWTLLRVMGLPHSCGRGAKVWVRRGHSLLIAREFGVNSVDRLLITFAYSAKVISHKVEPRL